MQLSRLHSSTCAPVTAKVLLRRSSSRRLLPSPQEVTAPAPERRPSLILPIPEALPPERRGQFRRRNVMSLVGGLSCVTDTRWSYESVNVPVLGSDCFLRWRFLPGNWSRSEITKPLKAENNRRGGGTWTYCGGMCVVGLQSDADSLCLICHNKLNGGAGGSRELQCTHTFHKEVTHTNTREDREWSVSIKMLLMFLCRLYKVLYERTLFCCTVKLLLWQTGCFVATEACGAH